MNIIQSAQFPGLCVTQSRGRRYLMLWVMLCGIQSRVHLWGEQVESELKDSDKDQNVYLVRVFVRVFFLAVLAVI